MSEDLDFFSTDFNNWNYNEMFIKPDIDPFNNNKKFCLLFSISYSSDLIKVLMDTSRRP